MEHIPKKNLENKNFIKKGLEFVKKTSRSRSMRYLFAAGVSTMTIGSFAQELDKNNNTLQFEQFNKKTESERPIAAVLEKNTSIENKEELFEFELFNRDLLPNAEQLDSEIDDIRTSVSVASIDGKPNVIYQKDGVYKSYLLSENFLYKAFSCSLSQGIHTNFDDLDLAYGEEKISLPKSGVYKLNVFALFFDDISLMYRRIHAEIEEEQKKLETQYPEKYLDDDLSFEDARAVIDERYGVDVLESYDKKLESMNLEFHLTNDDLNEIKKIKNDIEDVYEQANKIKEYVKEKYYSMLVK